MLRVRSSMTSHSRQGPKLYVANEEDILTGEATDIYFKRAIEVLGRSDLGKREAEAEIHAYNMPKGYEWAVLAGIEEVAMLLEGKPVDVYAMKEGEIFLPLEPVMRIAGKYIEYGIYESSILGILRHESSVATKAARIKIACWGKSLLFFGIRCVHPAVSPAIDRAAFIGGCDGVSGVLGASMIGEKPVGTMPHALILVIGNQLDAWRSFDESMPLDVPRIALCDTLYDERAESLMAASTLGDRLHGVRLDTPSSRRGDMRRIVEEIRWTLNIRGYKNVKIYVSGGLDEEDVARLRDVADGFGVGTAIAFPKSIDLAMDIVAIGREPISKKGKLPGTKQVYRCRNLHDTMTPADKKVERCPTCGEEVFPLLEPLILNGEIVGELSSTREIRQRVMERLEEIVNRGPPVGPILLST